MSLKTKRALNASTPRLSNLLKDERYTYSRVKYQNLDSYVNTCGSHGCHPIYRLAHDNLSLHTHYEYMKKLRDADITSYDIIVAPFIRSQLNQ